MCVSVKTHYNVNLLMSKINNTNKRSKSVSKSLPQRVAASVASGWGARGKAPVTFNDYLDDKIRELFMVELSHDTIKAGGHEPLETTETMMENHTMILDKGYVRLINVHGTELDIVNAARVSYAKESTEWSDKDQSLLEFLIRENHTSPLRHVSMTFECYVPLIVARQHWKYVVASNMTADQQGWSESSRRYITEYEEFYFPKDWRFAPSHSKQGSGDLMTDEDSGFWNNMLSDYVELSRELYALALKQDVAPELARLFLPAYGLYVRYRWTASLSALLHFLDQRLATDAQFEIRQVAIAVEDFTRQAFPNVIRAYNDRRTV